MGKRVIVASWGANLPEVKHRRFLIFNAPGTAMSVGLGAPGAVAYFVLPKHCRAIEASMSANNLTDVGTFRLFRWRNGGIGDGNQIWQTFRPGESQPTVSGGGVTSTVDLRGHHELTFHKGDVAGVEWVAEEATAAPGRITVQIAFELV